MRHRPLCVAYPTSAEARRRLVGFSRTSSPTSSSLSWVWCCWQVWPELGASSAQWPAEDPDRQPKMHGMYPRFGKVTRIWARQLFALIREALPWPRSRERFALTLIRHPAGMASNLRRKILPQAMLPACLGQSSVALARLRSGKGDVRRLTLSTNYSTESHNLIMFLTNDAPFCRLERALRKSAEGEPLARSHCSYSAV